MLRPACLLPAAQLTLPDGLLTPRSGTEVSLHYLGPATRRTDAYRDGTLTRGSGAASRSRSSPFRVQSFLDVTTHHGTRSYVHTHAHVKRHGRQRFLAVGCPAAQAGPGRAGPGVTA
jgi:hypothetical protein